MPKAFRSRPRLALLESRIAPSVSLIERGDYFVADGHRMDLSRRSNEMVLRVDSADVLDRVLDLDAVLRTFSITRWLDDQTVMLQSNQRVLTDVGPGSVIDRAMTVPGVDMASVVFQNRDNEHWLITLNEIVVALKPGQRPTDLFSDSMRFREYRPLWGTPDQFVVTIAQGTGSASLRASLELAADPRVVWAAPNFYEAVDQHFIPNDSLFGKQWAMENTGQFGGLIDADVDASAAWDISAGGSSSVVVAVLDDGIDITHPDLLPNLFSNAAEAAGLPGEDDDGNGWVDDVFGWDFTGPGDNYPGPSDPGDEHGTSVAGIAVGKGDNSIGMAGMAFQSRFLPVRIFAGPTATTSANIASAIYYAAGRNKAGTAQWADVHVMNCSWGGTSNSAITSALTWATGSARGGLGSATFISSGNSGGSSVSYPANLSSSNSGIIAVGASNGTDVRSAYSQYGSALTLVAPSSDPTNLGGSGHFGIVTTDRTGASGYNPAGDYTDTAASAFGGTSAASPLAAGVGALVLSMNPALSAAQVRGLLRNTTDLIGPANVVYSSATGATNEYGSGRVNALTALQGVGKAEAQLLNGRTEIVSGSATITASTIVDTSTSFILWLRNQGTSSLTLESVTAGGSVMVASQWNDAILSAGETASIKLTFSPTKSGQVDQSVTFKTNDADEGTYSFTFRGVGTAKNIIGNVYQDLDEDGQFDAGEPALPNREVYLDQNNNSQLDAGELSATSDANGVYFFASLANGTYKVRTVVPAFWQPTEPVSGFYDVVISDPTITFVGQDFGQKRLPIVVSNANHSGAGSLQQAILDANVQSGFDVIKFDPTFFATPRIIAPAGYALSVTDSLSIVGPGADLVTLLGTAYYTISVVTGTGVTFSMSDMTIADYVESTSSGTGISGGPMTLTNCVFRDFADGAVFSNGDLTVTDCVFIDNFNGNIGGGGAIATFGPTSLLTVTRSTFTGNRSQKGGAIRIVGSALIQDSTFYRNTASSEGGAIYVSQGVGAGNINVRNCTIAENTSTSSGGGIAVQKMTGAISIQNCTIVNNNQGLWVGGSVSSVEVISTIVYGNGNSPGGTPAEISSPFPIIADKSLIRSANGMSKFQPDAVTTALLGLDPLLGPFTDNGGETLTMALMPGSPAIDKGANPGAVPFDQRGPIYFRNLGLDVDIGAYEAEVTDVPAALAGITDVSTPGGTSYAFTVTYYDESAINVKSIDSDDIRIAGPNGFNVLAKLDKVSNSTNGQPRTATYSFTPPGNSWDWIDSGLYSVSVEANQVYDADPIPHAVPAQSLGTFWVGLGRVLKVTSMADVGVGSLRQIIQEANSGPGPDTVTFDGLLSGKSIVLSAGEIDITDSLTIQGLGSNSLTISGNKSNRVFDIAIPERAELVVINDVKIADGFSSQRGGAILCTDDILNLSRCVFANNSADYGGAVSFDNDNTSTAMTVAECVFDGNTANHGGAIALEINDISVIRSTFSHNKAIRGGAIDTRGEILIDSATFWENSATGDGGAIAASADNVTTRNSTFSGNTSGGGGGAIYLLGPMYAENCTIVSNVSGGFGGGIYNYSSGSTSTLVGCIVSKNEQTGGSYKDLRIRGTLQLGHSAIGVYVPFSGGVFVDLGGNLNYGLDLQLGPLANNGGPTQTHLPMPTSPLVDAGPSSTTLTLDQRGLGFSRVVGKSADIGSVESAIAPPWAIAVLPSLTSPGGADYQFQVTYFDAKAINVSSLGDNDIRVSGPGGLSQLAKLTLVNDLSNGTPRIATYKFLAPGGTWDAADNGTYSFALEPASILNQDGLAGKPAVLGTISVQLPATLVDTNNNDFGAGSLRAALDFANSTPAPDVISFDPTFFAVPRTISLLFGQLSITSPVSIVGPGSSQLTINANKSSRALRIDNVGGVGVDIVGLQFINGIAQGSGENGRGGGVYVNTSIVRFQDCIVTGNTASGNGGGISLYGGSANVSLDHCVISTNSAASGGGIATSIGSIRIQYSSITNNTGSFDGGGVLQSGLGIFTLESSSVLSNTIGSGFGTGAGLSVLGAASANVINCTFSNNAAKGASVRGGAIAISGVTQTLLQACTIIENTAGARGGGVFVDVGLPIQIENCIVADNSASDSPDLYSVGKTVLFSCAVENGQGYVADGTSKGNLANGIDLKIGPLADNGGPTLTRVLLPGSPCIDSGAKLSGNITTDQRGFGRISGTAADIGSLETQSPHITSIIVNGGAQQRSRVTDIKVIFDVPVSFAGTPSTAFLLDRVGPGGPVGSVPLIVQGIGTKVIQLTFAGVLSEFGSLIDGRYTLTILAGQILGPGSVPLSSSIGVSLHRLFGDGNGDGMVSASDFALFRNDYGQTGPSPFDFNADNLVSATDFSSFRNRYGQMI